MTSRFGALCDQSTHPDTEYCTSPRLTEFHDNRRADCQETWISFEPNNR